MCNTENARALQCISGVQGVSGMLMDQENKMPVSHNSLIARFWQSSRSVTDFGGECVFICLPVISSNYGLETMKRTLIEQKIAGPQNLLRSF